jgi:hypothetical protein
MLYLLSKFTGRQIARFVTAAVLICVCGCGDFFARKPTELQTKMVLGELRQIKRNQNIRNPLPELYRRPAETLDVDHGVQLFYFCRHRDADKLAQLVNTQFSQFFRTLPDQQNPQGTEYPKPTYSVSPNNATNQLVIHCPDSDQADKVLKFLNKVDVPPIQVNIDCLVLERFADVTMDWATDTVEDLRKKWGKPQIENDLHTTLTDPFGSAAYTDQVEQQAARAEFERFKAEIQKAEALEEMDQIRLRLIETAEEVLAEKAKATRAQREAQKAKRQAEEAKAEIDRIRSEIDKSEAEADQAKTEKAAAENQSPRARAEQ